MSQMKIIILSVLFVSQTLFAQGFEIYNSNNSGDLNLTDKEREDADKYINKGLEQAIYGTLCEGIEKECQGTESKDKFLGVPNQMVEMLGKAYTMINGMTGAPLKLTPDAHSALRKENPAAPSDRPDYCARIPMVGETLGRFTQQSEQQNMKNLPNIGDTDQKQQLFKAARSHEVRATTSTIQASTYGAATACYTGMITLGGVALTEVALKLPALSLLTAFYTKNAIQQTEMAKKIKAIADRLPGPGDCNPITKRKCFCTNYKKIKEIAKKWEEEDEKEKEDTKKFNEELANKGFFSNIKGFLGLGDNFKIVTPRKITLDTANYDKYCTSLYHQNPVAQESTRVSCLDNKGIPDPFCGCAQTDSCMDKQFITTIKGIGKSPYTDAALNDLVSLSRGELRGGSITGNEIGSFASSRAALRKLALQYKPVSLTEEQKLAAKIAEASFGVPKEMAAHLAVSRSLPGSRNAGQNMIRNVLDSVKNNKKYTKSSRGSRNKNLDQAFYKGNPTVAKKLRERANLLKNRKDKSKSQGPRVKSGVLRFANMATNQSGAQIHKRKTVSVFTIISSRYQKVQLRGLILIPDKEL